MIGKVVGGIQWSNWKYCRIECCGGQLLEGLCSGMCYFEVYVYF